LQKRWPEAEVSLRRALELQSDFPRARNNLALVLARTGRLPSAHQEFVKAGCTPAEAHSNLAYTFLLDQNWREAQHQFDLALAADPNTEPAKKGMATLRAVAQKTNPTPTPQIATTNPAPPAAPNYPATGGANIQQAQYMQSPAGPPTQVFGPPPQIPPSPTAPSYTYPVTR
jgi:Flp pilus assembly protein TadD